MATAKQIAATGPRTEFGTAASRLNALKHGIDAQQQIMFTESADDLAELAAEYRELHNPGNADERFLVDTLVNKEWRLRRMRCVEADLWLVASNLFLDNHFDEIPAAGSGYAFKTAGPTFERLQRVVNSCERGYHRALKELQRLQAAQPAAEVARSYAPRTPQPEDSTTTSESPASFHTNSQTAAANPPNASPLTAPEAPPPPAAAMDAALQAISGQNYCRERSPCG